MRSWRNEGTDGIKIAPFGSHAAHGRGRSGQSPANATKLLELRHDPIHKAALKAEEGYMIPCTASATVTIDKPILLSTALHNHKLM